MKKLLLINPPISRYDTGELAPPLGLLVLAHQARNLGLECRILDLNLPDFRHAGDNPDSFYENVVKHADVSWADEIGITSMGVNSHVAYLMAKRISDELGTPITLGGHHLSAIADLVHQLWPEVVVATPAFRAAANSHDWRRMDQPVADYGDLYEDFDLSPYFAANERRVANVEAGRGCRYNCAFCYSPVAHAGWYTRSPSEVAMGFRSLASRGFTHAFVVDDNMTNDRVWLRHLTEVLSYDCALSWNGYATVRDLDPDVMEPLVDAGCKNLYLGVDAATPRLKRRWGKNFFRSGDEVVKLVSAASSAGLGLTAAFILLWESESRDNIEALELALRLRRAGAEIRLSILTPYPGTRVDGGELVYTEVKPSILMDLPVVVVENPLARTYPEFFPWHAAPAACDEWQKMVLAVHAAQTAFLGAPEDGLPDDGTELWRAAISAAQQVQKLQEVHKVELRARLSDGMRRASLEVW
jgi:hypothetical protein